jgi:hypothetical protein
MTAVLLVRTPSQAEPSAATRLAEGKNTTRSQEVLETTPSNGVLLSSGVGAWCFDAQRGWRLVPCRVTVWWLPGGAG